MDIPALSMGLAQMKVSVPVSMSVTKKAMDTAEVQMAGMLKMMDGIKAAFGQRLDIRV